MSKDMDEWVEWAENRMTKIENDIKSMKDTDIEPHVQDLEGYVSDLQGKVAELNLLQMDANPNQNFAAIHILKNTLTEMGLKIDNRFAELKDKIKKQGECITINDEILGNHINNTHSTMDVWTFENRDVLRSFMQTVKKFDDDYNQVEYHKTLEGLLSSLSASSASHDYDPDCYCEKCSKIFKEKDTPEPNNFKQIKDIVNQPKEPADLTEIINYNVSTSERVKFLENYIQENYVLKSELPKCLVCGEKPDFCENCSTNSQHTIIESMKQQWRKGFEVERKVDKELWKKDMAGKLQEILFLFEDNQIEESEIKHMIKEFIEKELSEDK